ncbi:MAG: hypothetical protein R3E41_08815 [Burkholderiaceae bacterium]
MIGNLVGGAAAERRWSSQRDEPLTVEEARCAGRPTIERVQGQPGQAARVHGDACGRRDSQVSRDARVDQPARRGRRGGDRAHRRRLQDRILMETVRYGPLESLAQGVRQTWDMSLPAAHAGARC